MNIELKSFDCGWLHRCNSTFTAYFFGATLDAGDRCRCGNFGDRGDRHHIDDGHVYTVSRTALGPNQKATRDARRYLLDAHNAARTAFGRARAEC
jgi:hypothetical protein